VAERRRRRARSLRVTDAWSGHEIIFFYVPAWRRMVCYLRDPVTYYFEARLYAVSVCVSVKYKYCARRSPSSNLVVESKCCITLEHTAWEGMTTIDEVRRLIESVQDEAAMCAQSCHSQVFGVVGEVTGVEYYALTHPRMSERGVLRLLELRSGREPEEYCCHRRCTPEGAEVGACVEDREWWPIRDAYPKEVA